MFGFIKSLFGSGAKKVEETADVARHVGEQVVETSREVVDQAVQQGEALVETVVDTVSDNVAQTVSSVSQVALGADDLPPLETAPGYIDRDEFDLPSSPLVASAQHELLGTSGKGTLAQAQRVYEYSMAASLAYDLRVDREILALAALFFASGEGAAGRAKEFCLSEGMWPALAEKVHDVVSSNGGGVQSDCRETRAFSLGVLAEQNQGSVPYINQATSAETMRRNAA